MTARFILSLDCEGKWGVADHLRDYRATLSDENLRRAYTLLLATLAEFDVAATFAFVGCFMLSRKELLRLPLSELAAEQPYLTDAASEIIVGEQGWTGDWAVELAAARRHEIGLHGVTHTPWTDMTAAQARREMNLIPPAPGMTFVYPRNKIAHTEVLREFGIAGYRAALPNRSRLQAFLSEWNVFSRPDLDPSGAEIVAIPPGYFINWRHGLRRLVPIDVSRLRARNLLSAAVREGSVVHFWCHPENLATAPRTAAVLRAILEEVARSRDRGQLVVQTQRQYCEAMPTPSFCPSGQPVEAA